VLELRAEVLDEAHDGHRRGVAKRAEGLAQDVVRDVIEQVDVALSPAAVLEAFDGRPTEHTRIPVGRGICGQAVAERRDLNVPDVTQAEGYLACSIETRAELVVLIRRHDQILGQIDIDSDVVDGFPPEEEAAVRTVADALAALL